MSFKNHSVNVLWVRMCRVLFELHLSVWDSGVKQMYYLQHRLFLFRLVSCRIACAVSCWVISCCVMSSCVVSCWVPLLCRVMSCCTVGCGAMLCCVVSCWRSYFVSHRACPVVSCVKCSDVLRCCILRINYFRCLLLDIQARGLPW